jgi:hypothetical protein
MFDLTEHPSIPRDHRGRFVRDGAAWRTFKASFGEILFGHIGYPSASTFRGAVRGPDRPSGLMPRTRTCVR